MTENPNCVWCQTGDRHDKCVACDGPLHTDFTCDHEPGCPQE